MTAPVKKMTKLSEELAQSILSKTIDLPLSDVLRMRPSLVSSIQELLSDKRSVALTPRRDEEVPSTYIVLDVGVNQVAFLLDTGATCSILSELFLNQLGLTYVPLEKPKSLLPASGEKLEIVGSVELALRVNNEFVVNWEFAVLRDCYVPAIIGLDFVLDLGAVCNYSTCTFSFDSEGEVLKIPIYTRKEISREFQDILGEDFEEDSVMIMQVMKASLADVLDDDQLLAVRKKKPERVLPPVPVFRIERKFLDSDEFEEDFAYFDLPGGVDDNFENLVAEKVTKLSISMDTKTKLSNMLLKYRALFPNECMGMPGIKGQKFRIDLDPKAKPVCKRLKAYSAEERSVIKEHVDAMLQNGIISPCNSPWGFLPTFAPKSDGSLRFCINFKALNDVTIKDKYPIPLIDDCLRFLNNRVYYSAIDCFAGYWQIDLETESRQYCTFRTPFGSYCFNVLPFGLTNAVSFFQGVMENIFKEFVHDFVVIYLDDLCIASMSEEQHLEHLEKIFKYCVKYGVCLKFKKCNFFTTRLKYLGFIVDSAGIAVNPEKVTALSKRTAPRNVKELRSFHGMVSYFRRFIENFSEKMLPLSRLLKSSQVWKWEEEEQVCFDYFKTVLTSAPILKHFNPLLKTFLSTDASKYAIGAVLEQEHDDGNRYPVGYYSRKLTSAEINYLIYEKEGLALISAVKFWDQYLKSICFICYTDNSAISAILNDKQPCGRMIRWRQVLFGYDAIIEHRLGKDNPVADFISRVFLAVKEDPFISFMDIQKYLETGTVSETGLINDKNFRSAVKHFVLVDGVLFRRSKFGFLKVLFSLEELKEKLNYYHDNSGHFATKSVYDLMKRLYYRPRLYHEIYHYIRSCRSCQEYSLARPVYEFTGLSPISGSLM